jgi:hypothetical protein
MVRGSSVLIFMAILVQSVNKHLVMGLQLLAICQVPIERATAGNITFHGLQEASIYCRLLAPRIGAAMYRKHLVPHIDCTVACGTRCG